MRNTACKKDTEKIDLVKEILVRSGSQGNEEYYRNKLLVNQIHTISEKGQ